MFYAHFVLAKKGPLARIWLAAHWDKKLTKAHVFETNIQSSVEGILQPKVKMALRTSGHLLLGIVRIYSRKAKYLLADCNEAFIKIKMAFRPGAVDLPEENRQAHVNAITLPEVFHDFETGMPDLNNIDMEAAVTLNQSRAEDITLKEDYGSINLMNDDGFGDMGFEAESEREGSNIDEAFDQASMLLNSSSAGPVRISAANASTGPECSANLPEERDFGAAGEHPVLGPGEATGSLFEPAGLFADASLEPAPPEAVPFDQSGDVGPPEAPVTAPDESDDDNDDMYDMAPSMGGPSSPESSVGGNDLECPPPQSGGPPMDFGGGAAPAPAQPEEQPSISVPPVDQTTLLHNEDESFALAPLDATLVQGLERAKAKRKRKLIVDEVKNISGEEMKSQLSDTTDIVTTLDLAPPTKRLMHWKETGGVEKLFALPGRPILSRNLSKLYQRHLTTKAVENEDFVGEEEEENEQQEAQSGLGHQSKRPRLESEPHSEQQQQQYEMPPPPTSSGYNPEGYPQTEYAGGWGNDYGFPGNVPPQHMPMDYGAPSPYHMGPPPAGTSNMMGAPMVQPQEQHSQMFPHMEAEPLQDYRPPSLQSPVGMMQPQNAGMLQQSQLPPGMLQPPPTPGMLQPPPTPGMHQPPTPGMLQQSPTSGMHQAPPTPGMHQAPPTPGMHQAPPTPGMHQQPPTPGMLQHSPTAGIHQQLPTPGMLQQSPPPGMHQPPPTPGMHQPPPTPGMHQPPPTPGMLQPPPTPGMMSPPQQPHTPMMHPPPTPGMTSADVEPNEFDALVASAPGVVSYGEGISSAAPPAAAGHPLEQNQLDDDDDYGAPASVGPVEEQQADETYEQFEERILTKRTVHMLHLIRTPLESGRKVRFSDVARNNLRKQVAQKFYTFLVLKKQQAVELSQEAPYAELYVEKGPKYEQALL